ncbi:U1 small nuclear ribonucleoprotein 70 kDa isoform X1 [Chrysemys picta bellii]|uniref:U1 small nuclear ribonucleoprotein 70 kDa isoform X1 n=1 Tax=Chrysemys picta bellii TaxID=8478 RepID=UPI0032B122DA
MADSGLASWLAGAGGGQQRWAVYPHLVGVYPPRGCPGPTQRAWHWGGGRGQMQVFDLSVTFLSLQLWGAGWGARGCSIQPSSRGLRISGLDGVGASCALAWTQLLKSRQHGGGGNLGASYPTAGWGSPSAGSGEPRGRWGELCVSGGGRAGLCVSSVPNRSALPPPPLWTPQSVTAAYKHADGKKIDGRRVLVDVERGRTVKGWRPRRLGGGLGGTRRGGADVNIRHSGRDDTSRYDERDRERERDRRDRSRERDKERERRRSRSRERRRRTRSREKEERKRSRERSKDKDKERERKRHSRSRERKRDRDRERDKKEELPEGGDAQAEEVALGELGLDRLELKLEGEEKGRDRDRDRERDRRRSHRDRDKDRDRERDRERRRERDRDREHKRERGERGERGAEKRDERAGQDNGMAEPLEETSQDMFLDQESMQSGDGYMSTENGYLLEPPLE